MVRDGLGETKNGGGQVGVPRVCNKCNLTKGRVVAKQKSTNITDLSVIKNNRVHLGEK